MPRLWVLSPYGPFTYELDLFLIWNSGKESPLFAALIASDRKLSSMHSMKLSWLLLLCDAFLPVDIRMIKVYYEEQILQI